MHTHPTTPAASIPPTSAADPSSISGRFGARASISAGLLSSSCSAAPSEEAVAATSTRAAEVAPASTCVIFNCTPSARPGEAISLQGSFGATAEVYLAKGNSSSFQKLAPFQSADGKTKAQDAGSVLVQAPAGESSELYRLYVQENGQKSPYVYVNRARGLFLDSPEVVPGEYLRIFGHNLQVAPGKARVRFEPKGGGKSLLGQVNPVGSDDRKLVCHTPAGLAHGAEYVLYVSNSLGNDAETKVEQTVKTLPAGVDYFHLGVGWAPGKYKTNVYNAKTNPDKPAIGNGTANDLDAINDSIQKVWKMGGGIVRLPAGTYKLSFMGFGLHLLSGVVLMGDGKDQTKIVVQGNTSSNPQQQSWTFLLLDGPNNPDGPCRRGGICNLTYENQSTPSVTNPYNNLVGKGVEFFIKGCRFKLNESAWLEMPEHQKLAIINNEFTQGINFAAGIHGPLRIDGTQHWAVRGNTVNYAVDGISINNADSGVFEHNVVYRLGGIKYPTERDGKPIQVVNHVLAMNFTRNAAVLNNTFKVKNWPTVNINDGETIISEGIGYQRQEQDTGTATGGDALTLQDSSKSWKSTFPPHQVVAIVYGRGAGQWRPIKSRSGSQLTVDRAWDLAPDNTSRYSIFNWSCQNWLVQGNTMEGNRRGITLYQGAINQVAIVDNKLINNGAIDFTPIQQGDEKKMEFNPAWNNEVIHNTVNVANDPSNGGFIGVHAVLHAQAKTFGIAVLDFVMRNNTLIARTPNVQTVVDANYPNGLFAYHEWHPGAQQFVDEGIPAVLGTIIEGNTLENTDKDVYLSAGSYQTLIRTPAKASSAKAASSNASLRSASSPSPSPNLVHDDIFTNAVGHGSVRTIIL